MRTRCLRGPCCAGPDMRTTPVTSPLPRQAAVLEQQMISTIAGVRNLYVDLVSLQDAVKVQQQALSAAELLLNNDRQQMDVGRLAPIEVARAESLVTSTQLMLP